MTNWFSNLFSADERFITHRYYSSRMALLVGIVMMAGWFYYEMFANDVMRVDLMVIMTVMALTKVLSMLYFRFFD